MMTCAAPDPNQLAAERLANYLDCQAQGLGTNGFAHFAGTWFGPALLWGCLTIYVALIGYRLIFGAPFGAREAVLATLRAGVVIAFATSWSAYETVVYRVVNDGPAELASQLLPDETPALSLPEAAQRLDEDYSSLQAGTATVTPPPNASTQNAQQAATSPPQPGQGTANRPDPIFNHAGFPLVVMTVGSLGALKLASGLLLGIGPLSITLGLFDVTLGVLVGWTRALLGVFVAITGGMCLTSLDLGFIEAQLAASVQTTAGQSLVSEPVLMAAAVSFAIAMAIVLIVAFAVGCSFRIPRPLMRLIPQSVASETARRLDVTTPVASNASTSQTSHRAYTVAEAALRLGDRDSAIEPSWATPRSGPLRLFDRGAAPARASIGGSVGSRYQREHRRRLTRGPTPIAERRNRT